MYTKQPERPFTISYDRKVFFDSTFSVRRCHSKRQKYFELFAETSAAKSTSKPSKSQTIQVDRFSLNSSGILFVWRRAKKSIPARFPVSRRRSNLKATDYLLSKTLPQRFEFIRYTATPPDGWEICYCRGTKRRVRMHSTAALVKDPGDISLASKVDQHGTVRC